MKLFNGLKSTVDKFDFIRNSKKVLIFSGSIIFIGIILFLTVGFNLGIDFTGGTVMRIQEGSTLEDDAYYSQRIDQIETVMGDFDLSLSVAQREGSGSETAILIRYQDIAGATSAEMEIVNDDFRAALINELGVSESQIAESQRIGATASATLLLNALLAVLFATILMLVYIAIRFELVSGLSAIIALIHDVGIMLSLVLVFQMEINSAFVAALITIIGYSINDTIVVFDRVRENKKKEAYANRSNIDIGNISIKHTLIRTLNTSFTTLFTISMLAILTVPAIREFAIPIIFGLVAGTLSSSFVAAPFWAYINDYTRPRRKGSDPFSKQRDAKTVSKRTS